MTLAVIVVRPGPFLAIIAAAAIAATLAALASGRGVVIPVVVVELMLGIVIGPHGFGLHVDEFTSFFSDLGLALLFFFAGYEIDVGRVRGKPITLALLGWGMSLALAYAIAGVLFALGVVVSDLYTGSAMTTTAIGTLIPILSDSGELRTRFGRYMLAAGAVGEFGPILVLTLLLSAQGTLHNAVILVAFIAVAVVMAILAVRSALWTIPLFERTLESSSQLAVRWILVLIFALVLLAFHLGLDLLLGGFAAGVITRQVLAEREMPAFDSKLTAIAFGVFVPFFFIVSGMNLDLPALFASVGGVAKMLLFLVLFLVVRGTPALVLYRAVLDRRERLALALMSSTQLPLVLAITTLATTAGHMRRSTAAALVGAAVLSALVFPVLGLRLRGDRRPSHGPGSPGRSRSECRAGLIVALYAAISNAVVRCLRDHTGRGPMKARTTIRDNLVLVILEQTLTKGEQVLVKRGRDENVLGLRREYQEAMREDSSARVAELTGRKVIAMMSANHIDPDLAAEIYVLDGPPIYGPAPASA